MPKVKNKKKDELIKLKGRKGSFYQVKVDSEDLDTFGKYLLAFRQKMGLTQTFFSQKYNVNQSFVCGLERNMNGLTEHKLRRACIAFGFNFPKMKKRFLPDSSSDNKNTLSDVMKICTSINRKIDKALFNKSEHCIKALVNKVDQYEKEE